MLAGHSWSAGWSSPSAVREGLPGQLEEARRLPRVDSAAASPRGRGSVTVPEDDTSSPRSSTRPYWSPRTGSQELRLQFLTLRSHSRKRRAAAGELLAVLEHVVPRASGACRHPCDSAQSPHVPMPAAASADSGRRRLRPAELRVDLVVIQHVVAWCCLVGGEVRRGVAVRPEIGPVPDDVPRGGDGNPAWDFRRLRAQRDEPRPVRVSFMWQPCFSGATRLPGVKRSRRYPRAAREPSRAGCSTRSRAVQSLVQHEETQQLCRVARNQPAETTRCRRFRSSARRKAADAQCSQMWRPRLSRPATSPAAMPRA